MTEQYNHDFPIFTKEMKKDYTILAPNMSPIHFEMLAHMLSELYGYNLVLLDVPAKQSLNESLKYVHNDICYPAMLVIGQMLYALKSGKYDLDKTALLLTQTGGGCRASNYIHLLRKALIKNELEHIPVISLNFSKLEKNKNSGFTLNVRMLRRAMAILIYGDMLLSLSNQTRPYEVNKGETDRALRKWIDEINKRILAGYGYKKGDRKRILREIATDFDAIAREQKQLVKVGIVGEIYVKYSAIGNNHLEDFLAKQNCEAVIPGLFGFILYCIDQRIDDYDLYGGKWYTKPLVRLIMRYLTGFEKEMLAAFKATSLAPPSSFYEMKSLCKGIIGYGCKMGEGWLLTAEMNELLCSGVNNIICIQPFGCLPNHIAGKGMIRKLKDLHSRANIVPIDYDPGATEVNQQNRIKLMLSVASERVND